MSRNNPFRPLPQGPRAAAADNMEALTDAAMTYADLFVTEYYKSVNVNRNTLASYYLPANAFEKASITFNGMPLANGAELQNIFTHKLPKGHADVETIDCHILNPNYQHPGQPVDLSRSKTLISLFIVVGGIYKSTNAEEEFHDTIVLVPNPEIAPARNQRRPAGWKEYLIASQTFRIVTGDIGDDHIH